MDSIIRVIEEYQNTNGLIPSYVIVDYILWKQCMLEVFKIQEDEYKFELHFIENYIGVKILVGINQNNKVVPVA